MDEFMSEIKKIIVEQIKPFKYNQGVLDEMEQIFLTNNKYKKALLKIIIKDNKMEIIRDTTADNQKINTMIELLKKFQKYADDNNKKILNCTFYLYISEVYTYEYQQLPFFVLSRPENRNGIIIPDESFIEHDVKGMKLNWDELKEIIKSHCGIAKYEKINKLYFRGSNTGTDKHNLRKLLEKERRLNTFYDITVGLYNVPIYDFCKYKYLLNLPGNQPWSIRWKYLLLMKSLMINVDVRQHYEYTTNDRWMSFYGQLFENKIHSIDLIYDWYENDPDKNKESLKKLVSDIKETYTYYEDNPDAYDEITNNAYKKINLITLDLVFDTIILIINEYAKQFI